MLDIKLCKITLEIRICKVLSKKMIRIGKQEEEQLEQILKENGVGLPPSPPERPVANIESIPVGARFNDPEIAVYLAQDIATGLVACSQAMGLSIREDIGMMFGQFHTKKAQAGVNLMRLQKKKDGWFLRHCIPRSL